MSRNKIDYEFWGGNKSMFKMGFKLILSLQSNYTPTKYFIAD